MLVIDKREPGGYVTPFECVGEDATYVSRYAYDKTSSTASRSGACRTIFARARALNAIQIAESLVNRKLLQPKKKAA